MLETTTCPPHHWLIEPAQGTTSKGRCQGCGEVRTFQNSYSYDPLNKEGAIARKPCPGRPKKNPEAPKAAGWAWR